MLIRLMCALCLCSSLAQADNLPDRTVIDDYVQTDDGHYRWQVVAEREDERVREFVISLTSQKWLTEKEVNNPVWHHWLTTIEPKQGVEPKQGQSKTALLYVGGGSNKDEQPSGARSEMISLALSAGTVVAELGMVPNQPLVFHQDGNQRYEDDLIAYGWDQYLNGGDARWLARNAMVKSAVRAMDAVTELFATRDRVVDRFVVAGGSKRGWTTWLTGAMDQRVVAIVPIVIDVLNVNASMQHHFEAYGFWARAVGDYVDHKIMRRFSSERLAEMYSLVDPYNYRHRLTMPKLIINATGDQFFLPDSSRFYLGDLRGETYLRYVPNTEHSLGGSDALESVGAFLRLISEQQKPPQIDWQAGEPGHLTGMASTKPTAVKLWQIHNPNARDFRTETEGRRYQATGIERGMDGLYRARVEVPERGWTAFFMEFEFDVGGPVPLKLTSEIKVVPDTLPFAGKPLDLPNTITMICQASGSDAAENIVEEFISLVDSASFGTSPQGLVRGDWTFVNWQPAGRLYDGVTDVQGWLVQQECDDFRYQLESGAAITVPPN